MLFLNSEKVVEKSPLGSPQCGRSGTAREAWLPGGGDLAALSSRQCSPQPACVAPFTDGETEAPQGQMTSHPPTATPQAIRLPAEDSYSMSSDFRICKVPELLQIESSLDAQISKPVKSRTALMDAGWGRGNCRNKWPRFTSPLPLAGHEAQGSSSLCVRLSFSISSKENVPPSR